MPIRKRRPQKSLNKNQERLMRRAQHERTLEGLGTLATRYPTVGRLEIKMEFVSPEGHQLSSEQRNFEGDDTLDLTAPCQGRCGNGRMDMDAVVGQMINAHQPSREIRGICKEILFAGSADTCNCELRCSLTVHYLD